MSFFPNPYLLYEIDMTNLSNASYNGLQLEVRKHTRSGMQFQASYVFSKTLTDANALRGLDPQIDNAAPRVERSRADSDLTHVFKLSHYFPLPFGPGHRFNTRNTVLRHAIEGWGLAGIALLQTGNPVSVLSGRGTLNRGARSTQNSVDTNATMSQLRDATGLFINGNGAYWIDPSHINPSNRQGVGADGAAPFAGQLFFNPQPGTQGSLQRRSLDGPPFKNYNFSIVKEFKFAERHSLEFHADFFNLFNHPNFLAYDDSTSSYDYNVNNSSFGRITNQNTTADGVGSRLIQYSLTYRF
jgi:hypothetical protein